MMEHNWEWAKSTGKLGKKYCDAIGKLCKYCNEFKLFENDEWSFSLQAKSDIVYPAGECKACRRKSQTAWRQIPENAESHKRYMEEYNSNPENEERIRHCKAQYYLDNKEKITEYKNNHRKMYPEIWSECRHRREALEADLEYNWETSDWNNAMSFFGGRCCFCGKIPKETMQKEHWISVHNGGGFIPNNILPSCKSCNCSKHSHSPIEWLQYKFPDTWEEIYGQIRLFFGQVRQLEEL
jgi:hypothetical protein